MRQCLIREGNCRCVGHDLNRFAVELEAGQTYRFDVTGSPGGRGTLPDTFFRAIYNSEGQYQPDSYKDDFEGGRDSRVTFTPTESGTYYARVSGDRDEVGSYTLSVTDVTPEQASGDSNCANLSGHRSGECARVTCSWGACLPSERERHVERGAPSFAQARRHAHVPALVRKAQVNRWAS